MGGVGIGKIKCSFYEVFLKVMFTKYCTVEQNKNGKSLKPVKITTKMKPKAAREHSENITQQAQR